MSLGTKKDELWQLDKKEGNFLSNIFFVLLLLHIEAIFDQEKVSTISNIKLKKLMTS